MLKKEAPNMDRPHYIADDLLDDPAVAMFDSKEMTTKIDRDIRSI
jgi:hypothetical protein